MPNDNKRQTPTHIRIEKCSSPTAWYAARVGEIVPVLARETLFSKDQGLPGNVYWCRTGGVYNTLNYVLESDAEPVNYVLESDAEPVNYVLESDAEPVNYATSPDGQRAQHCMSELLALLDRYNADLAYTTDDDGIHVRIGRRNHGGFFDREDLRKLVLGNREN